MRLLWKLMLTYTCVIVGVLAAVSLHLDRAMGRFSVDELSATLAREARLASSLVARSAPAAASDRALDELADLLGDRLELRATIIDARGRVRGDSEVRLEELDALENHADRPEILAAWEGNVGRSMRYSETLKQNMLYTAIVMPGSEDGRMVMRLAMPLTDVSQVRGRIRDAILAASALGLVLALVLAYWGSRYVSRPVAAMTQMARNLAAGDFSTEVQLSHAPVRELRVLSGALHDMRREIRERIDQTTVGKSRLEAVLASITEGILVTARDGRVQMTNRAFCRLFGADPPTEGRLPVELIRDGEVQEAIDLALETGRAVSREMSLPGVPERHLDVHVAPILQNGTSIGSVAVFYDITELRRLEQVRKDFVANVSHELRTPLTAIKGCADTLAEGALEDGEAARRFVQSIQSNSDRLHRLLDDLLDLSRLESEALRVEPEVCQARGLVDSVINPIRQAGEEKEISITIEVPQDLEVRCDPKLIEQALINLLDNAVKYTAEGGSVRVLTRAVADDGRGNEKGVPFAYVEPRDGWDARKAPRTAFEVEDTGIGIPSDTLHRVFERFYRVDRGRSRALGGTGLGLSIVRHIVVAHGERAYVKSELGKGSTFGFTLPLA